MTHPMDGRIIFHDDIEVMEVDFSNYRFASSKDVNESYDALEEHIAETGEEYWFFLVNYHNTRIDPDAWFAFSRRGKTLNMAHSQGSVRFDPSDATKAEIARRSKSDEFDANLFDNRDDALKRLKSLPSKRLRKIVHTPTLTRDDFVGRITFDAELQVMHVDFSNIVFSHSLDVDNFYDFIEERVGDIGGKWYFAVNYDNCRINPEAWVEYAQRGKRLNINFGLGSVRYAPGSATEAEIRLRAETQDFNPNIRNSREEALARIEEMKREAG